ncbi:MAG: DNA-deoxyinosine glycosylase [Woeseiaceae bacterium]
MTRTDPNRPSRGFAPIARRDARILVLGSLPSRRSLQVGEYYAHSRNAFWPIIAELTGVSGAYAERCAALTGRRIALWDVLESSERPGSMDAAIRRDTARANDFDAFFAEHPHIERICFNGRTAARLFKELVEPSTGTSGAESIVLPSTSPAYAALPFEDKLGRWREALAQKL